MVSFFQFSSSRESKSLVAKKCLSSDRVPFRMIKISFKPPTLLISHSQSTLNVMQLFVLLFTSPPRKRGEKQKSIDKETFRRRKAAQLRIIYECKTFFFCLPISLMFALQHTQRLRKRQTSEEGREKNFGHFSSPNNIFIWRREWLKQKTFPVFFLTVARATPTENKFEINLLLHISHSTAVYQGNHLPQGTDCATFKIKTKEKVFALTCGG